MTALTEIQLGDVAAFIRGITFKTDQVVPVGTLGSAACMRTRNVQAQLDLSDVWGVPESFIKREEQYLIPGDILVSSANSWNLVGKCCWVPDLPWRSTFGGFISVLRPNTAKIDPRYLFRWFASDRIQARVRSFGQQTTNISNLNIDRCLKLKIPLPPLPEQQRIAEILGRADALRARRRSALAQLDTLAQYIFLEMFGEPLDGPPIDTRAIRTRTPTGCTWELLTDVARLATGHTPDRENSRYWNGEIPWITLTDIRVLDGAVATATLQNVTPLGIENSPAVLLPKGTVCFSRTASVGFVTVMGREMATSQDFMNWVCGPRLDPTYLMWALIMSRKRLLALSSGSTHRTIYMRVVEQFRVLVPPIEVQRDFAKRVEALSSLKSVHRRSATSLDNLFRSLQQRAFEGSLVAMAEKRVE